VQADEVVARFDSSAMHDRLEEGEISEKLASLKLATAREQAVATQAQARADREEAELELEQSLRYQMDSEEIFSRHDIIESSIDGELAQQRRRHATESLEIQRELDRAEQELLEIERRQAQLQIDQARQGLGALEVQAPHAGLLTHVRNWRGQSVEVGAEMWRGQPIAELPDLETLEGEVYVLEADAGGVREGCRAEVVVGSRPETVLRATVRQVDTVASQRTRSSPVQYFGVALELTGEEDVDWLKPGQRIQATIFVEDLDAALVVPRTAVLEDEDGHHVFVRSSEVVERRAVEVTAASHSWVVIGDGLAVGEKIALQRPANAPGPAGATSPVARDGS
jgi:RND family efflux transporter MFP subunit